MSHFVATYVKLHRNLAISSHQVLAPKRLRQKMANVALRHFTQIQFQHDFAANFRVALNHNSIYSQSIL
jgi:hypothetical protein